MSEKIDPHGYYIVWVMGIVTGLVIGLIIHYEISKAEKNRVKAEQSTVSEQSLK